VSGIAIETAPRVATDGRLIHRPLERIEIERIASGPARSFAATTPCCSAAGTTAQGTRVWLDAWAGLRYASALQVVESAPDRGVLQPPAVGDVEWFGTVSDGPRNALLRSATVFCARRCAESRSESCSSRQWPRGPIVRFRDESIITWRGAEQEALLVPPL